MYSGIFGQKSFQKNKKGRARRVGSVPRHNCKKASIYAICAKLCQEKSMSWHSYYSLIPTLLVDFDHCATCATSFFWWLKKKFALEFPYTLAHYVILGTFVPFLIIFLTPGPCNSNLAYGFHCLRIRFSSKIRFDHCLGLIFVPTILTFFIIYTQFTL